MNRLILSTILAVAAATQAAAQCAQPETVTIPDGRSATLDQMLQAQTAVRTYLADMEAFLACLNEEIEAQPEDTPQEVTTALIDRHNAAVTDMESVAARFNEQRIAYQEAHPN